MRKIYTMTLVSSLGQALVCGILFSWLGLEGFIVAAGLTLLSVWLGFFYMLLVMRRNVIPTVAMSMAIGAILGFLSAYGFCFWFWYRIFVLSTFFSFFLLLSLIGVVVGVPFGLVNFAIWRRIGFIQIPA